MMQTDSPTDAELVVLSLIAEQPLHGYQIEQLISDRNMRAWTDLSTSSIYYLISKLEEKGWIEPTPSAAPSRQGPPRKVYRITREGERAWKEATLNALSRPRITYTNFLMGLHNLGKIPPSEAHRAVQQYKEWLEGDLERQRQELENLHELGAVRFPVDVLFEYGFSVGQAELDFLEDLISKLGDMTEDIQRSENQ
jgi:DNA-binding PadR family transcriptional regulator